ncbi:MAG: hypothetical protein HKO90_07430 [Flavobacteriaceae bacterium]|nr:hypothetical protein [Flavobacteriaceae bacterium]
MVKILRLLTHIVLALILISVGIFAYAYLKYSEEIPTGITGEPADELAMKMLNTLDHDAYQNTDYLEWTFRNRNHYNWDRVNNTCEVNWQDYKVILSFNDNIPDKVYVHNFAVYDKPAEELIEKAKAYFNNDSFWLVAPYKVFDEGVIRQLIKRPDGSEALLVTYTKGGTTPGDSYLWLLKDSGEPYAFKMWTSVIPVPGMKASWDSWIQTASGARLPDKHRLLFLTLSMGEVKGLK